MLTCSNCGYYPGLHDFLKPHLKYATPQKFYHHDLRYTDFTENVNDSFP